MAEYLAPGVYVEETSFRQKSIAGVGTSTAAFVGMTSRGPLISAKNPPPLLTSFADFEQIYGGFEELVIGTTADKYKINYIAHAAEAFFNNGGGRLYVARVQSDSAIAATSKLIDTGAVYWTARTKGGSEFARSTANFEVSVQLVAQAVTLLAARNLARQSPYTLVRWEPTVGKFAYRYIKDAGDKLGQAPKEHNVADPANPIIIVDTSDLPGDNTITVNVLTLNVTVSSPSGHTIDYLGLGLNTNHPRFIGTVLGDTPTRKSDIFNNPIKLSLIEEDLFKPMFADIFADAATTKTEAPIIGQRIFELVGGSDGSQAPAKSDFEKGLEILGGFEDISIIAAPGAAGLKVDSSKGEIDESYAHDINDALIAAAEKRRAYRIAVLDSPNADEIKDAVIHKGKLDSTKAALYYPWIVSANPLYGADPKSDEYITLPPSGFVCGVYARTDVNRGVWKPPANEVIFGVNRFSRVVHFGEQERLNPLGINCLRAMPNRGNRVWGARTTSSDPEWMYVNVRRYFLYLEASIDQGTQWAVFEPNGEKLWFNMRETVSDFLYNEWVNGALLGINPKEAFFVRCDRSTMTQNDIDNGRLVCLIGVAAIKPAEFVIFRIGQKLTSSNG